MFVMLQFAMEASQSARNLHKLLLILMSNATFSVCKGKNWEYAYLIHPHNVI